MPCPKAQPVQTLSATQSPWLHPSGSAHASRSGLGLPLWPLLTQLWLRRARHLLKVEFDAGPDLVVAGVDTVREHSPAQGNHKDHKRQREDRVEDSAPKDRLLCVDE
eukprot:UN4133